MSKDQNSRLVQNETPSNLARVLPDSNSVYQKSDRTYFFWGQTGENLLLGGGRTSHVLARHVQLPRKGNREKNRITKQQEAAENVPAKPERTSWMKRAAEHCPESGSGALHHHI